MSVTIKASPAEVFSTLVEARKILDWSGQKGRVASRVGGKVALFDGWVKGVVLDCKDKRTLAYTWLTADWPEETKPSVVRYKLAAAKNGTKLTLVHSELPSRKEMLSHKSGWTEFFFDPLRNYFADRK